MTVTAAMVKELRERTGLGMMDCKKALVESDGDIDLAIESLRKSSGMKAAKKSGRIAADGLLACKVDNGVGVLVEVNCETDFAARDGSFLGFVALVTSKVFELQTTDVTALGLDSERDTLVQKIGENISIRRAEVFSEEGILAHYLHSTGRIGVLLSMTGGDDELGKDIAMHIAAMNPAVVGPEDASAELILKEREIYTAQAQESGKPAEIIEKMIDGRIKKYLAEISLTEQAFVKDGDVKIGALLKKAGATVNRFVRYEVGEGIEKPEDDFAAEVKKQLGQ